MANFFTDNHDLQYYFEKGVDWEPLVRLTEYDFKAPDTYATADEAVEFYRDALTMAGQFVAEEIAPYGAEIDRKGVELVDGEVVIPERQQAIFKQISELDLHWLCLPRELGGMNCPLLMYFFSAELFARADVSTMTHHGFHGGIALALLAASVHEGTTTWNPETGEIESTRFQEAIEEIGRGDAWGSMDITEPNAGSDMAALRAYGEQDEDGNWYVSGEKIFITSGHGKYHFVIARTEKNNNPEDPMAGLGGLSFFLVKTYEDLPDGSKKRLASLDRVEEKLGHHGSVTATVTFDRTPAQLIGKRGEGFKYMLMLMNNARLGVGFESLGLCESAYRLAREYAEQRPSMGKTIDRHELIADMLDEMESDIEAIRALSVHAGFHEELARKLDMMSRLRPGSELERKQTARKIKRHKWIARRATPLLKYFASEKAVEMARKCMQIHGGNGYMKEYGAEKLLRDSLVMPIYEGTSQIQALMAMKDTLGRIIKNPQAFVKRVAQTRWRALSARDPLERSVLRIKQTSLSAQQYLIRRTAADKFKSLQELPLAAWSTAFFKGWNPKRDFAFAMLHAERLLKILADELIAEILLEQAQKHPERRVVLERFLERAEPRSRALLDEIQSRGTRLLDKLADTDSEQQVG